MGVIKSLFEKWTCKHKWSLLARTEYIDGYRMLFVCEKCGKEFQTRMKVSGNVLCDACLDAELDAREKLEEAVQRYVS